MSGKPVIKWAGGKTVLLNEIKKRIDKIHTSKKTLYDVFVGGGSVAIKFAADFNRVVINDKNPELSNMYRVIKNKPKELITELERHEKNHSHDYYYTIRALDRLPNYSETSDEVRAARLIYLNKTCFNGLFRVNRNGYFNVPLGRQKNINIFHENNIIELNKILQKVEIYNQDFSIILKKCNPGDLVYLDPPYDKINENSFVQYNAVSFDSFDQVRLVEIIDELTNRGVYVIASNALTKNTEELYKRYLNEDSKIYVKRSIASKNLSRKPVEEILIDNIKEVNEIVSKSQKSR